MKNLRLTETMKYAIWCAYKRGSLTKFNFSLRTLDGLVDRGLMRVGKYGKYTLTGVTLDIINTVRT